MSTAFLSTSSFFCPFKIQIPRIFVDLMEPWQWPLCQLSRKFPYINFSRFFFIAVVPRISLGLGSNLNPDDIEEGDDVYFECKVHANPAAYKVVWKHNCQKKNCSRTVSSWMYFLWVVLWKSAPFSEIGEKSWHWNRLLKIYWCVITSSFDAKLLFRRHYSRFLFLLKLFTLHQRMLRTKSISNESHV